MKQFLAIDLTGVSVRRASTEDDLALVASLRASAFSRISTCRPDNRDVAWLDDVDRSAAAVTLIGYDSSGEAIATLRVQDGRKGPVELSNFVALEQLLQRNDKPVAQFARLGALKRPRARDVMFGMFKSAWSWCFAEGLKTIILATPSWSKPMYDFMLFRDLGEGGRFNHPYIGNIEHITMTLPVQMEELWRRNQQGLSRQFFDMDHLSLSI